MKYRTNWKVVAKSVGERLVPETVCLANLERDVRKDMSLDDLHLLKCHLKLVVNTLNRLSYELRNGHEPGGVRYGQRL